MAQTGTSESEVLVAWDIEVDLPPHPGFGRRRPRPPEEALRRENRRRASVVASLDDNEGAELGGHGEKDREPFATAWRTEAGLGGHGLKGHVSVDMDPWADRRESLRSHVERARRFERLILTGVVKNAAEVAEREGLTRARICQLLKLLKLSPEVLAQVEAPEVSGPVPPEKELRKLVKIPRVDQLAAYWELVEAERFTDRGRGQGRSRRSRVRRSGLQHQFERARQFQAALDAGEVRTLEELGRREGVTGGRVAQLLNLLHLAPEIIEVVDVPVDKVPRRVSEARLRELARLHDHDEQVWAFRRLCVP